MILSRSGFGKPAPKVTISIAPLIDVMFLLVIFLLVATVFPKNEAIKIEKPIISSPEKILNESIKVRITEQGDYYIDGQAVTLERMKDVAQEKLKGDPDKTILIEADTKARIGPVTRAIDALKSGGARSFAIAADKKNKNPK